MGVSFLTSDWKIQTVSSEVKGMFTTFYDICGPMFIEFYKQR